MAFAPALEEFAAAVGEDGPVECVGGRTQWTVGLLAGGDIGGAPVGGPGSAEVREVSAPAGVVAHEPGEMIVRVRAGTTVADLHSATAAGGQYVALEAADPASATVGGVLACGQSGPRRLGWGPIRDTVLEVTMVTSEGRLIRAGAPLVKNVTGYDLCRLVVGSVGTLGFMAEVVLRCRPVPEAERWYMADAADPFDLFARLYRPLSVLWDGRRVWVGLAGYAADIEFQHRAVLEPAGFAPVPGAPRVPSGSRYSLSPAVLRELAGAPSEDGSSWLAEIGVGVVHGVSSMAARLARRPAPAGVTALTRRVKERFDPSWRLNPGRCPLSGGWG